MAFDYSSFTERARTVVRKAFELSGNCGVAQLEPPILAVTVLQEGRDMVEFVFRKVGVDRVAFCQAVAQTVQHLPRSGTGSVTGESAATLEILSRAKSNAASAGSRVVALEHLFLALCEVAGPVSEVARRYRLDLREVKSAISEFAAGNMSHAAHEASVGEPSSLKKYARNLLRLAEAGEIEPVIGRDAEIRRVLEILSRKSKNNPVLVGEPGTGKTAIVEGLAHRILRGDVPDDLRNIRLYELSLSDLIAGASAQGEFEERLKKVIKDVVETPNTVLFIDEMHMLIGAGQSSGAMDAANILKPELARGRLRIIGATTIDEYRKHVEKDKAFERRFMKVLVEEPDIDSAITILRGIKPRFEKHHRIRILDEAVTAAVRLSARYVSDRFLPDKAIDLLDEAASRMRIDRSSVPEALDALTRQITMREVELASIRQDGRNGKEAEALDREIAELREKENTLNARWANERSLFERLQAAQDEIERLKANREIAEQSRRADDVVAIDRQQREVEARAAALAEEMSASEDALLKPALDEEEIMEVVTSWTHIPVAKLKSDEAQNLLHLEDILHERVIGQDRAISAVSKVIRRNRTGLGDPDRPIGSFLFLGSTGVGKTELAKALAEYLFNSRDMIVRIDMSEYQQEHSVARLFGAPPGYVGYDQGGQLTEAVRRKPYSVVLFDEIEKAHPKVFETLLQVLDDGRMTDGQGRTVNFKNTIIIMTSNIGQRHIAAGLLGEGELTPDRIDAVTARVLDDMRARVAPEFINRIDETVMFLPLTRDDIHAVTELQLKGLRKKLVARELNVEFTPAATDWLADAGYSPEYGARPVKRVIDEHVVNALSMELLAGRIDKSHAIRVDATSDAIVFSNVAAN